MCPPTSPQLPESLHGHRVFATTRWSMVLQAGGAASEGTTRALEQLCRIYWYPLYAFARHRGMSHHDAEDSTQAFFTFVLKGNAIQRADRERGRFRGFLLSSFQNFQKNEWDKASALKRGGGHPVISIDAQDASGRYQNEPHTDETPDRYYDRQWAMSLLDQVMVRLRREYTAAGRAAWLEELKFALWGNRGEVSYAEIAGRLGSTEGAVKAAMHRLRNRFRETLHDEVAQTVDRPEEVEDELNQLLAALSR